MMKRLFIFIIVICGLSCLGRNGYPIDSLVYYDGNVLYGGRMWPNDYDSNSEKLISQRYSISSVMITSDTLLIMADTKTLFNQDLFNFEFGYQLYESFPHAKIIIDTLPTKAMVTNGKEDILEYSAMNDSTCFELSYALISTNDLLTLAPKLKIGDSVAEIFETFGLYRMGIDVPAKKSFHMIFFNGTYYKNIMIKNKDLNNEAIDIYILNNKVGYIKIAGENTIIRYSRYPVYRD